MSYIQLTSIETDIENLQSIIGKRFMLKIGTGFPYTVADLHPLQINKQWLIGVVYHNHEHSTYITDYEHFKEKFVPMGAN
jgi:hypothetical protein